MLATSTSQGVLRTSCPRLLSSLSPTSKICGPNIYAASRRTLQPAATYAARQTFRPAAVRHHTTAASTAGIASLIPKSSHTPTAAPNAPKNLRYVASAVDGIDIVWPHPVYTNEQMDSIRIAHRETKSWSDWVALSAVRLARWSFDFVTGYKHDQAVALGIKDPGAAAQKYAMTEEKWVVRFIFLESIAGVPGMVGGMVRHLHSLRCLRRDHGWIETLLEESQNERMHLLTFLKFRDPPAGWLMRSMILAAQGVFTNMFFFCYLISPRTCHRFVGYLESEAVITYTRAIADLQAGKLPKWEGMKAPPIAKDYFKMKDGEDSVLELLRIIRADEAKHCEVNHTLANLEQAADVNPYKAQYHGIGPKPSKDMASWRPTGWEREEVIEPGMAVKN